jgi:hypothetical protein
MPALRDGDVVFQESRSQQSAMVRALTRSRWTHMGVVFVEPAGPVVFEAVTPVRRTPLNEWISRGEGRHYVVKRLRDADTRLGPERVAAMRTLGEQWAGRPYDLQFRWSDESLYCSELVHKLFERSVRVRLGKLERARDMNLADPLVQRALATRFAPGKFDPEEPVVTPGSIFEDEQLVGVEQ